MRGELYSEEISSLKRLRKIFPRNYLRIRMAIALIFADTGIAGHNVQYESQCQTAPWNICRALDTCSMAPRWQGLTILSGVPF